MGLIKNTDAHRVVKHGFQDLGDLKLQAERVLDEARAEARRIVDEARSRAEAITAESEPRGFAEGEQRGLGEGREEGRRQGREEAISEQRSRLEQLVPSWTEALDSFEAQRSDLLLAAREDLLELALTMGAKITRRVVEADPGVATDQVAEPGGCVLTTGKGRLDATVDRQIERIVDTLLPRGKS